jgi:cell wall-associated NlpC family hydrolase
MAQAKAKSLQAAGVIDAYYIVGPEDYPRAGLPGSDKTALRDKIVGSAKRFLGVPYRWGGSSPKNGFDCSGLTMAVYQLNGLNLPRSSSAQWRTGAHVDRSQLSKADLVFFATSGGSRISHVGIYVGDGRFIHAPGRGKKICITSFSNLYFRDRFLGARTYL